MTAVNFNGNVCLSVMSDTSGGITIFLTLYHMLVIVSSQKMLIIDLSQIV